MYLTTKILKTAKPCFILFCRRLSTNMDDVIFESHKTAGVIILNRPLHMNALNFSMAGRILTVLNDWAKTKKLIVIKGVDGKAFCAGGDLKLVAETFHQNNYSMCDKFFANLYKINGIIGGLEIPYVSLIDGIIMGAGVGLSIHGSFRVATETTLFAMPETKIGFFPDVGATYWMPRLPGYLGLYLALTGQRLKGTSVYHAGIATHYVERANLKKLEDQLLDCTSHTDVKNTLDNFHKPTSEDEFVLKPYKNVIAEIFSEATVEQIVKKLQQLSDQQNNWAKRTLELISEQCPTSLKLAQKAFYKGRDMNLNQCLDMENQIAKHLHRSHNAYEGVRALLIDKDNNPKWKPSTLEEVTNEEVDAFFEESVSSKQSKL